MFLRNAFSSYIVLGLFSITANASVLFTIERLDDTHAIISGSGSIGPAAIPPNGAILALESPFTINPPANSNSNVFSGELDTLKAGSISINHAYIAGSQSNFEGNPLPYLYFFNRDFFSSSSYIFREGDFFSGSMSLILYEGATFAPIGSSGSVFWGASDGTDIGTVIGNWRVTGVTQVPVSSGFIFFSSALLSFGFYRRTHDNQSK